MPTTTANLGLRKPEADDLVDVGQDIAENMDLIDAAVEAKAESTHDHDADYSATTHDHDADYEPIGGGGGATILQQDAEPGSPAEDDLWIDTNAVAAYGVLAAVRFTGSPTTVAATASFVDILSWQITFTAPASGNVIVTQSASAFVGTSMLAWRLADGGVAVANTEQPALYASVGSHQARVTVTNLVTGLTPGDSYTFTWQQAYTAGTAADTRYGGADGMAVMMVQAAP